MISTQTEKSMMDFVEIPFGSVTSQEKRQAAFIIIFCRKAQPWLHYHDADEEKRKKNVPMVLMINRWDGKIGFPGGKVNQGESIEDGAIREVKEEIGYLVDKSLMKPFCSFTSERSDNHAFTYEMDFDAMKKIFLAFNASEHFLSEITGLLFAHITEYEEGRGYSEFLKNNFAGSAKCELTAFVERFLQLP